MVEVSVIFFLAGLAIAVTVINALLKQAGREEYSYLVLLVGLVVALLRVLPLLMQSLMQSLRSFVMDYPTQVLSYRQSVSVF